MSPPPSHCCFDRTPISPPTSSTPSLPALSVSLSISRFGAWDPHSRSETAGRHRTICFSQEIPPSRNQSHTPKTIEFHRRSWPTICDVSMDFADQRMPNSEEHCYMGQRPRHGRRYRVGNGKLNNTGQLVTSRCIRSSFGYHTHNLLMLLSPFQI